MEAASPRYVERSRYARFLCAAPCQIRIEMSPELYGYKCPLYSCESHHQGAALVPPHPVDPRPPGYPSRAQPPLQTRAARGRSPPRPCVPGTGCGTTAREEAEDSALEYGRKGAGVVGRKRVASSKRTPSSPRRPWRRGGRLTRAQSVPRAAFANEQQGWDVSLRPPAPGDEGRGAPHGESSALSTTAGTAPPP
jgi:hypothetical protein